MGAFVLLAATFAFWGVLWEDEQESTQSWFREKWITINSSPWLTMPEKVIEWFLRAKAFLGSIILNIIVHPWIGRSVIISIPLILVVGCAFYCCMYIFVISIIGCIPYGYMVYKRILRNENIEVVQSKQALFLIVFSMSTLIVCTRMVLSMDISYAFITMILVLPAYSFIVGVIAIVPLAIVYGVVGKDLEQVKPLSVYLFCFAVIMSFSITFLAFFVGHVVSPQAWVPQTFQMLISNVIFDGVTMVATFALLEWAVKRHGFLRIPFAIVLDTVVAALFACFSLYFGLLLTAHALSVHEILNILVARSADGSVIDYGPYFWAMHTTFLPTLFYLTVILLCWCGKALLTPVVWFFGKGQEHKNPLKLTAAMCTLMAVFLGLSFKAVEKLEKYKPTTVHLEKVESLMKAGSVTGN